MSEVKSKRVRNNEIKSEGKRKRESFRKRGKETKRKKTFGSKSKRKGGREKVGEKAKIE